MPKNNTIANTEPFINSDGLYLAADTLYSPDANYKSEITITLLKLNRNLTVQVSESFTFKAVEDTLKNDNVTHWLNNYSSYRYEYKGKREIVVSCYFKQPKRGFTDYATANVAKVSEVFVIDGNTLIRKGKSNANFSKKYVLRKELTNNHKSIAIGNACKYYDKL